jgi:hypothetical protein
MKNYFNLLIFLLLIPLNGCNDESNILLPSDPDTELKAQILGLWTSQNNSYSTIYYSNSMFIDSVFAATDSVRDKLLYVVVGNYNIKDSILSKSNISIEYVDSELLQFFGLSYIFRTKYLKFTNNSFSEYVVDVYEPINGNNNVLWGSWSSTQWVIDTNYTYPQYIGRMRTYQIFEESLNKVTYWSEFIDENNYPIPDTLFSTNLVYDPPYLDITGQGDFIITVKFKNNKMFWWYDYEPFKFYRNN